MAEHCDDWRFSVSTIQGQIREFTGDSIDQRCPPVAGAMSLAGAEAAPARKVESFVSIAYHPDGEGVIMCKSTDIGQRKSAHCPPPKKKLILP